MEHEIRLACYRLASNFNILYFLHLQQAALDVYARVQVIDFGALIMEPVSD